MACKLPAESAQYHPPVVTGTASLQHTGPPTDQIAASNAVPAAAAAAAAAAADPVCPACLGVLQTPEGALHAVPAAMLAGLPEAEGNAGSWQTCTSGSCDTLAQCIRSECAVLLLLLLCSMQVSICCSKSEIAGAFCTTHFRQGQNTTCCF